jgi:hypothetical protein
VTSSSYNMMETTATDVSSTDYDYDIPSRNDYLHLTQEEFE